MADSAAFNAASEVLENETDLDRLEARGTIRLLLKQGGLNAKHVTPSELQTVAEKWLENELGSRGVARIPETLSAIKVALSRLSDDGPSDSPENVFARLGGDS